MNRWLDRPLTQIKSRLVLSVNCVYDRGRSSGRFFFFAVQRVAPFRSPFDSGWTALSLMPWRNRYTRQEQKPAENHVGQIGGQAQHFICDLSCATLRVRIPSASLFQFRSSGAIRPAPTGHGVIEARLAGCRRLAGRVIGPSNIFMSKASSVGPQLIRQ